MTYPLKFLVVFSVLFSACATVPNLKKEPAGGDFQKITETDLDLLERDLNSKLTIQSPTPLKAEPIVSTESQIRKIPLEMNEEVKKWVRYFIQKDEGRFTRFSKRGKIYKKMIQGILEKHGVPPEIYYLALIESGFQTHASSRAKAVGIWQFISGTAKRYGLRVDGYVDERQDPIRSTEAAAKYLKDLHNIFQSWYLAMAAYNAGEMRIMGAIMRGKTRDFWKLVDKKVLPSETMNYIPKFIAASMIDQYPDKFGLEVENPSTEYPDVEAISIPSPINFADIAHYSGVSLEALKEVNPHVKRGITPPAVSLYPVWIPKKNIAQLKSFYPYLQARRLASLKKVGRMAENVAGSKRGVRKDRVARFSGDRRPAPVSKA